MGAPKGHAPYEGAGRPKGSKNKNFLSLQFWFSMIADNAEELTAKEKIDIGFRAANLLVPKMQALPLEPGDSVDNAQKALEMVQELERAKDPDVTNV